MAESLRIVQVLSASVGGIGRHVASVVPRLVGLGHDVRIYAPALTVQAQGLDALGVEVRPLGDLRRLSGADVVHAHGYKAGALALPFARFPLIATRGRTPLVVTWHNAVLGTGRTATQGRLLQRLAARGADLTLGASSDLVDEARRLGARRAELAPVAAPALAAPRTPPAERRAGLGLGPEDLLVLSVTRLAPQKNLPMLLDVAAAVRDRADLHFVVVGDGPLHAELAARIAADGLRVRLVGASDDVGSWWAAADLALLTSTWEARALVAQEALLAGVPLLSTRVGGIEELVGDDAALFALDDVPAATLALLALADDPAARTGLAARGRRRAATWPDEDAVARDLVARYRTALRRPG